MKQNWLSENIKAVLALIIVILGFTYFYMCSIRGIKPDPQIVIAFVSTIATATGYYFGSSQGASKKDDVIASQSKQSTVENAETVQIDQTTKP